MPAISFRQIEDPVPGEGRTTILLIASCGPIGRLPFGGEQKSEIEWPDGSNVANIRLGGGEEEPMEIGFSWKDTRFRPGHALVNGRPVASITDLCNAFDQMRVDQALIEVDWRGRKQVGHLKRFVWFEGKADEPVEAQARIEWVARPSTAPSPPPRRIPESPRSFTERLAQSFEDWASGAETIVTFARSSVEEAADAVAAVRADINKVRLFADQLRNFGAEVAGVRRSIGAGLAQLLLSTADVADALFTVPSQLAQSDDAWAQIKAASYLAKTGKAASTVRHMAAREQEYYQTPDVVIAAHTVVKGETIWSISKHYYGSSQYALVIARENKLPSWVQLRPGQKLRIPPLEQVRATS